MDGAQKVDRLKGEFGAAPCDEWQVLRSMAAAGGELDPAEESRLAAHLAECPSCSADLSREKELLGLITARHAEPDATLLASCRAGLQDKIDREEDRGWISRTFGVLLPSSWLSPRPAWSAAILLLIGFSVGLLGPRVVLHEFHGRTIQERTTPKTNRAPVSPQQIAQIPRSKTHANIAEQGSATAAAPESPLAALDLHRATVASIRVHPSGAGFPPEIQLQMDAPQPFTMQGTVDDGNVRSILFYVLRHGDLFPPNVRLGAVDALSARSKDPDVHSVLSHALQKDASPAVRVRALQALHGSEPEDLVTRMLLDALSNDQDASVREQAIDTLRDLTDAGQISPNDEMLSVLRHRMQSDPDPYIRSQSAAVVQELIGQ